ncbi:MAG: hypothetical protein ACFBZ9_02555 [Sphingomonadales bacterium]
MSFEIKVFGSPVEFGSFGFFDLMDANKPAIRRLADIVDFTSRKDDVVSTATQDEMLPTAA